LRSCPKARGDTGKPIMRELQLEINGERVTAQVEPRTHLADFLREHRTLTGTHIGCEHGVCGACTVLIDGVPARSCITFAVACDGAQITTIEGLRDDEIVDQLRDAFSANHGLQCGYCTPAMLVTCRDILTRLPTADERRIRLELSGNLCRCTGYGGILAAIRSVQQQRAMTGAKPVSQRAKLGPVGAHCPRTNGSYRAIQKSETTPRIAAVAQETVTADQWRIVETEGTELVQSFQIPFAREDVWTFLANLDRVVTCMPGARLTKVPVNDRAEGEVSIRLGPIVGAFAGVVELDRDSVSHTGRIRGSGRDSKSGSTARVVVTYSVGEPSLKLTKIEISLRFLLTGPFAQFSRSGLVKDVADNLTHLFATNLKAALSGKPISESQQSTLNAGQLAVAIIRGRLTALFKRLRWR
jgi:aerobic carbon-monoxide dehydrogenase small subunit